MCGRYIVGDPTSIAARFGIIPFHETRIPPPRFNIAPSQAVLTVVDGTNGREIRTMEWGFRPAWLKGPKGPPPINARAETLLERPMFRGALARGRCILPADGFYEWVAAAGKAKQPVHVRLRGGGLFGFAGLYAEAEDGPTCVIITTAANDLIAPLHQRMPVILDPDLEATWLDSSITDPQAVLPCLRALPSEQLELFPVGPLVSSVQNEGPELAQPARPEPPGSVQPPLL